MDRSTTLPAPGSPRKQKAGRPPRPTKPPDLELPNPQLPNPQLPDSQLPDSELLRSQFPGPAAAASSPHDVSVGSRSSPLGSPLESPAKPPSTRRGRSTTPLPALLLGILWVASASTSLRALGADGGANGKSDGKPDGQSGVVRPVADFAANPAAKPAVTPVEPERRGAASGRGGGRRGSEKAEPAGLLPVRLDGPSSAKWKRTDPTIDWSLVRLELRLAPRGGPRWRFVGPAILQASQDSTWLEFTDSKADQVLKLKVDCRTLSSDKPASDKSARAKSPGGKTSGERASGEPRDARTVRSVRTVRPAGAATAPFGGPPTFDSHPAADSFNLRRDSSEDARAAREAASGAAADCVELVVTPFIQPVASAAPQKLVPPLVRQWEQQVELVTQRCRWQLQWMNGGGGSSRPAGGAAGGGAPRQLVEQQLKLADEARQRLERLGLLREKLDGVATIEIRTARADDLSPVGLELLPPPFESPAAGVRQASAAEADASEDRPPGRRASSVE